MTTFAVADPAGKAVTALCKGVTYDLTITLPSWHHVLLTANVPNALPLGTTPAGW